MRSSAVSGVEHRLVGSRQHAARVGGVEQHRAGGVLHVLRCGSQPPVSSPVTPWWMSSQPSATRSGGGPAPIFSSSYGYMRERDAAVALRSRQRADVGLDLARRARTRSRCRYRSSVMPAGRCLTSPWRIQPMSHIGRCSIAYAGSPVGTGHRLGEEDHVLVGEQVQVGVEVVARRRTGPDRAAPSARRSSETASASRGPSGPNATYVIRCSPRLGIQVDARILDAAVVVRRAPSPRRARAPRPSRRTPTGTPSSQLDLGEADPGDVAGARRAGAAGTAGRRECGRSPG